jgi:NosR/NirI family nitrous oxide reductase transcriptional regulator
VYCGWLCPFGALQELINQASVKWLKLRQWEFPDVVHERLWAVKYIILMALFGLSLQSLSAAERYAEIEPFKTAIVMRFQREWAYVFYAVGLLALSAVNRKFYCKYLCPLGAALTIPARFRIFNWLRRRRECGSPCQVCAKECEVRAINSIGEINANECHYCLDCQVTYYNEHKCPPMVERRKRREKGVRARELLQGMESVIGASGLDKIETRSSACDDCTQGCKGEGGPK